MFRVVIDTNIYISAINFGGTPEVILRAAEQGVFSVFISPQIYAEIEKVLTKKFEFDKPVIDRIFRKINRFTRTVSPKRSIKVISKDPADDRILECALAADAEFIVSGDSDLLDLKTYKGIAIITPRQFLDSLDIR